MFKNIRKITIFASVLCIIVLIASCTVAKKISAAQILSDCKVQPDGFSVESVKLAYDLSAVEAAKKQGKMAYLSAILSMGPEVMKFLENLGHRRIEGVAGSIDVAIDVNISSKSKDTLWIKGFRGNAWLDTILTLPLTLDEFGKIVPGDNHYKVKTTFQIDSTFFDLLESRYYSLEGTLEVSLRQDDETVSFNFKEKTDITPERKEAIKEYGMMLLMGVAGKKEFKKN